MLWQVRGCLVSDALGCPLAGLQRCNARCTLGIGIGELFVRLHGMNTRCGTYADFSCYMLHPFCAQLPAGHGVLRPQVADVIDGANGPPPAPLKSGGSSALAPAQVCGCCHGSNGSHARGSLAASDCLLASYVLHTCASL